MDRAAKAVLWGLEGSEVPHQEVFPLEPVAAFLDGEKLTTDSGPQVQFWAHWQLAEDYFG